MQKLLVGRVLKPRGLKGEVKVQILTNRAEVFGAKKVFLKDKKTKQEKEYKILSTNVQGDFAFLFLEGVTTIEIAERLRNAELFVARADFPLAPDELLDADLLGCEVVDEDGGTYGTVSQVLDHGGGVVLVTGGYNVLYEDNVVIETDLQARKIVVRKTAMEDTPEGLEGKEGYI